MIEDLVDPRRTEPPFVLDERPMLESWLEFHRTTLLLKCEGLDDEARKRRPVPTSKLPLHGLIRHCADEADGDQKASQTRDAAHGGAPRQGATGGGQLR